MMRYLQKFPLSSPPIFSPSGDVIVVIKITRVILKSFRRKWRIHIGKTFSTFNDDGHFIMDGLHPTAGVKTLRHFPRGAPPPQFQVSWWLLINDNERYFITAASILISEFSNLLLLFLNCLINLRSITTATALTTYPNQVLFDSVN